MDEINPYSSPAITTPIKPPSDPASGGVWRQGKLLVMGREAILPERCVKTNLPAEGRTLRRDLSYYPPWVAVLILLNILIFAAVAVIIQKRATIHIGLCEERIAKRWRTIVISWMIVICSVCLGVTSLLMIDYSELAIPMLLVSIFTCVVGGLYGVLASRIVTASKIDKTHIWLRGVCPEYLAELPDFPKM